jgi:ribonuclease Z
MKDKSLSVYPLVWKKNGFFIKIFCSIPAIATGILLTANDSVFVIDPGDGILRDLNEEIGPYGILKISDIYISHGHHDHVGGIWSLLTYLSVMKRSKELNIYYPSGCGEIKSIYKAFVEVYKRETLYKINMIPIKDEKSFIRKNVKVKPFKVNHKDIGSSNKPLAVPSLGFKFTFEGKSICYGGDTAYCKSLVNNVKGSDLAIIEAGAPGSESSEMHLTINEAKEIGNLANKYFLVHIPK